MLAISADRTEGENRELTREASCPSIIYKVASVATERLKVIQLEQEDCEQFKSLEGRKGEVLESGNLEHLFTLANGYYALISEENTTPKELSALIELFPEIAAKLEGSTEHQQWNFLVAVLEADRALAEFEKVGDDDQFSEVEAKTMYKLRECCSNLFERLMGDNTKLQIVGCEETPPVFKEELKNTFRKLGWNH